MRRASLTVLATLLLCVPALGAAATLVIGPPATEQLVEGHTVFSVLQVSQGTSTISARFATAVAVLVRERVNHEGGFRFPGVLWFNDQYLVNPTSPTDSGGSYRYPCGGAVMAVNQGDPDPRLLLADTSGNGPATVGYNGTNVYSDEGPTSMAPPTTAGGQSTPAKTAPNATVPTETAPTQPVPSTTVPPTPVGPVTPTPVGGGSVGGQSVGGQTVGGQTVPSQTAPTATFATQYNESYMVTDPNDHQWIVDRYTGYEREYVSDTLHAAAIYSFPVWVVNLGGGPAFLPDDGASSCTPYVDVPPLVVPAESQEVPTGVDPVSVAPTPIPYPTPPPPIAPTSTPGETTPGEKNPGSAQANRTFGQPQEYSPNNATSALACRTSDNVTSHEMPQHDEPCAGWAEPADASGGYCYDGKAHTPGTSCSNQTLYPTRIYNAVLYFHLEDLLVSGDPVTHDAASADTNGCQAGTTWDCPGGDDAKEGNSHPFNPTPHSGPGTAMPCPPGFDGGLGEPTNHGGSTTAIPYCDHVHATRSVDLYFAASNRPFAPASRTYHTGWDANARNWAGSDTQGSDAPFHGTGSTLG